MADSDFLSYNSIYGEFSKGPRSLYYGLGDDRLPGAILNIPQTDEDDEWGRTERISNERALDYIACIYMTLFDPFGNMPEVTLVPGAAGSDINVAKNMLKLFGGAGVSSGIFDLSVPSMTLGDISLNSATKSLKLSANTLLQENPVIDPIAGTYLDNTLRIAYKNVYSDAYDNGTYGNYAIYIRNIKLLNLLNTGTSTSVTIGNSTDNNTNIILGGTIYPNAINNDLGRTGNYFNNAYINNIYSNNAFLGEIWGLNVRALMTLGNTTVNTQLLGISGSNSSSSINMGDTSYTTDILVSSKRFQIFNNTNTLALSIDSRPYVDGGTNNNICVATKVLYPNIDNTTDLGRVDSQFKSAFLHELSVSPMVSNNALEVLKIEDYGSSGLITMGDFSYNTNININPKKFQILSSSGSAFSIRIDSENYGVGTGTGNDICIAKTLYPYQNNLFDIGKMDKQFRNAYINSFRTSVMKPDNDDTLRPYDTELLRLQGSTTDINSTIILGSLIDSYVNGHTYHNCCSAVTINSSILTLNTGTIYTNGDIIPQADSGGLPNIGSNTEAFNKIYCQNLIVKGDTQFGGNIGTTKDLIANRILPYIDETEEPPSLPPLIGDNGKFKAFNGMFLREPRFEGSNIVYDVYYIYVSGGQLQCTLQATY